MGLEVAKEHHWGMTATWPLWWPLRWPGVLQALPWKILTTAPQGGTQFPPIGEETKAQREEVTRPNSSSRVQLEPCLLAFFVSVPLWGGRSYAGRPGVDGERRESRGGQLFSARGDLTGMSELRWFEASDRTPRPSQLIAWWAWCVGPGTALSSSVKAPSSAGSPDPLGVGPWLRSLVCQRFLPAHNHNSWGKSQGEEEHGKMFA